MEENNNQTFNTDGNAQMQTQPSTENQNAVVSEQPSTENQNAVVSEQSDNNKGIRFILTFLLGFIGSFIINHTSLKPQGYKSRTAAYFFLAFITLGIYPLVASISNFTFDPNKAKNIGYKKEL